MDKKKKNCKSTCYHISFLYENEFFYRLNQKGIIVLYHFDKFTPLTIINLFFKYNLNDC